MKRKRLMLLGVLLLLVTFPIGSLADSKLNKGLTNSFTNPPLKTGKIDKSKGKNKNNTNNKKKDKGKGSDGAKTNTVDPKNLLEIQEQGIKKILGDDYDKYVKDAKKLGTDIDSKKETQKKLIDAATYDTFDRPLTYDQFKDDLDRFTSKAYFKGDFWGFSSETNYLINSFVQAIFWVNKTIFSMMATIYDSLDKNSSLNTQIVDILNIAGDTYNSLMTSQVLLFVGGLFVSYAYYEYVKRGGGFFTSLLKLFVTFGVVTIFFTKSATGDYYLTRAYTNVDSALTGVASSVSKLENAYSSKGYGEGSPLDSYFEQAIWEPYAYMNADKVSGNDVKYAGLGLNLSEKDLKALLAYDSDDKKFKLNDKTMEEIVYNGDEVKIKNLSNNWGDKFSYAIGSIFKTTVLGIIIDAFAIFRFVLRITLLILFVLSPFVALISFIPTMQIVLLNFAKRIGITVGLSGFMDFFAIMALFIYKMIDDVVSTFFNNYLLVVFVEIIVLVMLWKKRDWLVSILTADRLRVSSSFGRFPNRLKRRFKGTVRSRRYGGRSLTNDMTKMAVAKQAVKGIRNRSLAGLGRGTVKGISGLSRAGQMGFAMAGAGYSREAASRLVHAQSQARKDRFNQLKTNFGRGLNHLKYNTLKLAQDGTRDKALKSHLQGRAGDVRLSGMQLASDKERARRKANVSKQRVSRLKEAHQLKQNQQREKQMVVKSVEDIRQKTGLSAKEAYKKYSHDKRLERRTSDYSQAKEQKTVKPKMTKESHIKRSAPKQKVTPNVGKKPKVTSTYSHEQLKSKLRRSSLKR
ncbi:hypothetical protein ACVRZC_08350 [Streptococcus hyointestinalis]|uniref:Membrane protein n=1 Tax=Streptococcus hyointestinalis TaxID=1337 RepID=A0A380KGM1_9STRE|nr:hypothetical protein [Streptococcus hyointestinalis]SUN63714.1 membrane protein [Streptococcus hyointestinalis]